MTYATTLPDDIWELVADHVDDGAEFSAGYALRALAQTCRRLHAVSARRTAWMRRAERPPCYRLDVASLDADLIVSDMSSGAGVLRTLAIERHVLAALGRSRVRAAAVWRRGRDLSVSVAIRTDMRALDLAPRPAPLDDVRRVACSILSAAASMHAAGVVHGCLCPSRIFTDTSGAVVFADFRFVRMLNGAQLQAAPALGRRPCGGGLAADAWAIGEVIYELGHGKRPCRAGFQVAPDWAGTQMEKVVRGLLQWKARDRMSVAQALVCLRCMDAPRHARPQHRHVAATCDAATRVEWVAFFDDLLRATRVDGTHARALLLPCASALRAFLRRGGVPPSELRSSGLACFIAISKLHGFPYAETIDGYYSVTQRPTRQSADALVTNMVRVLNGLDFDLVRHHALVSMWSTIMDEVVLHATLAVPNAFDFNKADLYGAVADVRDIYQGKSLALHSPSLVRCMCSAWRLCGVSTNIITACARRASLCVLPGRGCVAAISRKGGTLR